MKKKRVGILRGGAGRHYGSSLNRGGNIIAYIMEKLSDKYKPVDILVDKDYIWHCGGIPINPGDLVHKIDVAWNLSHPSLSNTLESLPIPQIRASSFLETLINNRDMLKEHIKRIGMNMPRHIVLPLYQKDFDGPREKYAIKKGREVFEKFSSPWIVKSFTSDSAMGIHVAKTFNELVGAIEDGVKHEQSILVEEFVAGKVVSIHSVPNFRNEETYVFPLENSFGIFSSEEKEKLVVLVKDLRRHLGAKYYLKSDFVLTPRGKVYLLQVELTPDLKRNSCFSQACESVGTQMHNVIEHMLEEAS